MAGYSTRRYNRRPCGRSIRPSFAVEVPVLAWPAPPHRLLRVSCQLYNERAHYERLAGALKMLL